AATPPADTGAGTSTDQPDDATVIMPTPPRQQSATPSTTPPPANPVSPTPAPPELDDQATLIASPAAPEPSPVPRAPAAPEPEPVPTPRPTQKDKIVPVPVLAGLGVLGLAIVLALAFWPGEDTDQPETASKPEPAEAPADPWQSAPAQPTAGTGSPAVTDPVYSDPVYSDPEYQIAEPATTEPEAISPEEAPREPTGQITATEDTREPEMSETVFEEPVVKDEAYFMAQIKTATAADRLTPSDQQGTATYFLTELIRYDSNSDRISEARTLISKRHLELAKAAREKSQWDAAQQHLDDALKVRLPDSYLP
ncbi:MAG: hypothetical protein R3208_11160, partial [Ketobacteraceae bacterium]|nr:hypothetical protein [Ketobacteraceae bacterium]